MLRRFVTGGILAVALALGGAACMPGPPPAPAGVSAAPLAVEDAGPAYEQMTTAYHEVRTQLQTAIDEGRSVEEIAGLASAVAGTLRSEAEGLQNTPWPDEIKPLAETRAQSATAAAGQWEQIKPTTPEETIAAVEQAITVSDAEVGPLREALGLPAEDARHNHGHTEPQP